jgi:hypothetical protein
VACRATKIARRAAALGEQRRTDPEAEDYGQGVGPVFGLGGLLTEESRVGHRAGRRCSRHEGERKERKKGGLAGPNWLEKRNSPGLIQRIVAC